MSFVLIKVIRFFTFVLLIATSQRVEALTDFTEQFLKSGVSAAALDDAQAYLNQNLANFQNTKFFAIIDYTMPSTQKRFYIFNTEDGSFEIYLVAHGRNSGELYSTSFSNDEGSFKSSLGFFETGDIYFGKHGNSLRLNGLSSSNSNALVRTIVIHGAEYVSESWIANWGRIGRSLGCPAVEIKAVDEVLSKLHGGAMIYSYYDKN